MGSQNSASMLNLLLRSAGGWPKWVLDDILETSSPSASTGVSNARADHAVAIWMPPPHPSAPSKTFRHLSQWPKFEWNESLPIWSNIFVKMFFLVLLGKDHIEPVLETTLFIWSNHFNHHWNTGEFPRNHLHFSARIQAPHHEMAPGEKLVPSRWE